MPRILFALIAGLVFGFGLVISRMIDPAKILGFLDIAGAWDPSLAFVMAGAIPVAALGFRIAAPRRAPLLDVAFRAPMKTAIDRRLVIGAALFGVGWGLVGYCPGPALTSLLLGLRAPVIFTVAMLIGMAAYAVCERLDGRAKASRLSVPSIEVPPADMS